MSTSSSPRLKNRPILVLVTSHWLAQLGIGLALTAMVTWLVLLPVHLRQGQDNPYIGIAMFFVVPAVLVLGVILTPFGIWLGRRRLAHRMDAAIDDRGVAVRRLITFLVVTGVLNLAIATQVTYRAVHHMESRQFCGSSCHVMTPEARAFDPGPHAGILCVDCHVGSGAAGWFASKTQGTRQLISVLRDDVKKPIAGAIESGHMVPSSETCEQCHWTGKFGAARLKIIRAYAEDATNTPSTTVLTMHVGGSTMGGIHGAHFGPGREVHFVANDAKRQDIPLVEYTDGTEKRVYVRSGAQAASLANAPRIRMQCIDCHNRPAHQFHPPDRALDNALTLGRLSTSLPFVKKKGVEILRATYATSAEAAATIPAALTDYYRKDHPEVFARRAADVEEAGRVLADIYSRNVFPELAVTWNTYPDNRGHTTFPGCFRCHEGKHATNTGATITKDCFRCHAASAVKDTAPEILKLLGLDKPIEEMRKR